MSDIQSTLTDEVPTDAQNQSIAEELAEEQEQISISKFFETNKQMLGFDSKSRAIITTVKEAVDNALDAAEAAEILPEIHINIEEVGSNYQVTITDNGPGIPKSNLPNVFASLLFGSRFNSRTQSRGQQGIGISSAVMYAQTTTGKAAKITSKTGDGKADYYELKIDTDENEPNLETHKKIDWDHPHGTRIVLEMEGNMRNRKKLHRYIRNTAVVNPHATITLKEPKETVKFERITTEIPEPPEEIKPHPHGIDMGILQEMLESTESYSLTGFLKEDFTRVGSKTAKNIIGEFYDFYFGRDYQLSTKFLEKESLKESIYDAISRKSADAKEMLATNISEDIVTQEGVSYTLLTQFVETCSDDVEDEFDERIGETVREKIKNSLWETLLSVQLQSVHTQVEEATSVRKDEDAVKLFAQELSQTEPFTANTDGLRFTKNNLLDAIETVANTVEDEKSVTFGETAQENIFTQIWEQTDRVDVEVPKVSTVLKNTEMTAALLAGMNSASVSAPPKKCLSPIGEELMEAGLKKGYDGAEFYAAATRSGDVANGSPFITEAGLAYGGNIEAEGEINLERFGNKVPLVFKPGGCIITTTIENINWRNYNLSQPGGSGLPDGPVILLVHVASTNIPFNSESKDAIASVPEISHEVEQAVRMVARKMESHINKQDSLKKRKQKKDSIGKIIPPMTQKFAKALNKPQIDSTQTIGKIMNNVSVFSTIDDSTGTLYIENNTDAKQTVSLNLSSPKSPYKLSGDYAKQKTDDDSFEYSWEISVNPSEKKEIEITSKAVTEMTVSISGLEEERFTYNTGVDGLDISELQVIPVSYDESSSTDA